MILYFYQVDLLKVTKIMLFVLAKIRIWISTILNFHRINHFMIIKALIRVTFRPHFSILTFIWYEKLKFVYSLFWEIIRLWGFKKMIRLDSTWEKGSSTVLKYSSEIHIYLMDSSLLMKMVNILFVVNNMS